MISELTPDQWKQVKQIRQRCLAAAVSTEPADRPRAEAAIAELYRIAGRRSMPKFTWCSSPQSAYRSIAILNRTLLSTVMVSPWYHAETALSGAMQAHLDDILLSDLWDMNSSSHVLNVHKNVTDEMNAERAPYLGSWWSYAHGQEASGRLVAYRALRDVAGVECPAEHTKVLDAWIAISESCGSWWPFADECIIMDRPAEIHTEPTENNRVQLHRDNGPALMFRDDWSVHCWHGLRVPRDLVMGDGWDARRILNTGTAWLVRTSLGNGWNGTLRQLLSDVDRELMHAAIDRMGWPRFVREAELVEVCPSTLDPGNGDHRLFLYRLPRTIYNGPRNLLLCTNGTPEPNGAYRQHGLPVPSFIVHPVAAAAWTYDVPRDVYQRAEFRR